MLPTPGDMWVSQALTNISVAYMQRAAFVADSVFPIVPSDEQGAIYFKYRKGDWRRADGKPRAPGTETAGTHWRTTTDNFFMEQYGLHVDVNDTQRATARAPFRLDQSNTDFLTQNMMLTREKIWADKFFVATPWATQIASVAATPTLGTNVLQWDQAASNPQADINYYSLLMQRTTGYRPNVLIVGPEVDLALMQNADIIDRVKYTQRGVVNRELIAQYLNVDKYLVAESVINTAPETEVEANDTFSFLFGKNALLAYANPSPGIEVPSAGYIFAWTGLLGSSAFGGRMKKFRLEAIASDRIEIEMSFDMKVVCPDLGIYFTGLVA